MQRLGDILMERGILPRALLEQVASAPRAAALRLGETLRLRGHLSGQALAHALAEQMNLPYGMPDAPPDPALYRPRDLSDYLAYHYWPHHREGTTLTLVTASPSPDLLQHLQARYPESILALRVISDRDFRSLLHDHGATTLTRRAQLHLRRLHPSRVADRVLTPAQQRRFLLTLLPLAALLILAPITVFYTLLLACNLFYAASLLFKAMLLREGLRLREPLIETPPPLPPTHAHWPIYSILVPMHHEPPEVITRLIQHLRALDYPPEALDIKLICEADDTATLAAIKAARPPEYMEILPIPPSFPRTKPKACNVAFQQIRGEYLVIFDAEDAPHPAQLKLAVARFAQSPPSLACLQAALNYENREENLLTELFSIEYSALFRLTLPALAQWGIPIPLGGTSNHLRVEALRHAGGWDAFNVTEDADLGVRLATLGYRTETLPNLTREEAPITLPAWMGQRTRWIKGYLQTWLVFMRDPVDLKAQLGSTGYYGFQFFVGAPALTFLIAPVFWAITLSGAAGVGGAHLPPWLLTLCGLSFLGGMVLHWLQARACLTCEGWKGMYRATLLYPFYWLLHSIAAARALWELACAPHYWNKTTHGRSRLIHPAPTP